MKDVMAVIRMDKMNVTKKALLAAGIPAMTASKVMGRGKGFADIRILQGAQEGHMEAIAQLGEKPKLIPKRLLTIVVPDNRVQEVVDILIQANQTGQPGDGKIFVLPVSDSVKIRTYETGESAV